MPNKHRNVILQFEYLYTKFMIFGNLQGNNEGIPSRAQEARGEDNGGDG